MGRTGWHAGSDRMFPGDGRLTGRRLAAGWGVVDRVAGVHAAQWRN